MEGDFSFKQPRFSTKYVLIEWDGVLSRNTQLVKPLFNLLKQTGVTPKIFTFRKKDGDNSDIFKHAKESDVLFSDGEQKRDAIHRNNMKFSEITYWIESDFRNVVDRENIDKLTTLRNNGLESPEAPTGDKKEKPYVFLDWDETMSLRPDFTTRFFHLFEEFGFTPKIFTSRKEKNDNSDMFLYVNEDDVFFANGKQKKDAMSEFGIKDEDVAFWLDDSPQDIIAIKDYFYLFYYYND